MNVGQFSGRCVNAEFRYSNSLMHGEKPSVQLKRAKQRRGERCHYALTEDTDQ